MKNFITLLCAGALLALMSPTAYAQTSNDVLSRDLKLMMSWFEGDFDNMEQTYFEKALNVPQDERHERIHSIFKKVDLPEIGAQVFYVQQYQNKDPANVYRQRLYSFSVNTERQAIALNILRFKNPAAVLNAHENLSKLAGLKTSDLESMPQGCTVYWKRQANQFIGYMDRDACRIASQRSGKTLIVSDDLILTADEIWIRDQARFEDGAPVFGNKAGIAHKLLKARPFTCWISVKNDEAKSGWDFERNLKIHDQGGEVWITKSGKTPEKVGIRLRNVRWPYGPNVDSFVMYALKEGQDSAVSYGWAEKTADRIGLNLRWMQASCSIPKQ